MIKHLKKKKRFLNRLHEIEERGERVSDQIVTDLQNLVKKQQARIQQLEQKSQSAAPVNVSELRDALTQMKSALSESTSDAINTQRLLDEQLVRLGNSLESAESKAAETALETSKVIARLESDLESQRKLLETTQEESSEQQHQHTEQISGIRSHYEREMQLLQDQYRSLRERHQSERQAHVAQHDRLQELLRLRVADVEAERTRVTNLSREVQTLRKELATLKKVGVQGRRSDVVSLSNLAQSWKRESQVFTQARESHMMEVSSLEKLLMAQQQHLLKQCAGVSASNLALRASTSSSGSSSSSNNNTKREDTPPMVEVHVLEEKTSPPPPHRAYDDEDHITMSTSKEDDVMFLNRHDDETGDYNAIEDELKNHHPPIFPEALRDGGDITPPRAHSPPDLGSPHDPVLHAHVMAVSTPAAESNNTTDVSNSSSSSTSSKKKKKKHRGHRGHHGHHHGGHYGPHGPKKHHRGHHGK